MRGSIQKRCADRWVGLTVNGLVCGTMAEEPSSPAQTRRVAMAGALLTSISPLLAQNGRLQITVTDPSGTVVNGAPVAISLPGGTLRRGKTGDGGGIEFSELPDGRYQVDVHRIGFSHWRGTANVAMGTPSVLKIRLDCGLIVDGAALIEPHSSPQNARVTGSLHITVRDATGAARNQADVSVSCDGWGPAKESVDEKGDAKFPSVPQGECRINVSAPGFQPWQESRLIRGEERLEAKLAVRLPPTRVLVQEKQVNPLRRFSNWLTSCTRR